MKIALCLLQRAAERVPSTSRLEGQSTMNAMEPGRNQYARHCILRASAAPKAMLTRVSCLGLPRSATKLPSQCPLSHANHLPHVLNVFFENGLQERD